MSKHLKLLLAVLSIIVISALWSTRVTVGAQLPTKTPIGEPPTKPPLVEELPTKTSLPPEESTPTPTLTPRPTSTATSTLRPSATASPTPIALSPVPTRVAADTGSTSVTTTPASLTPTATATVMSAVVSGAVTPVVLSAAGPFRTTDASASVTDPALPLITQALNIGGFILGLAVLGLFIWLGLGRVGRAITTEMRTVSLATLRLQHEAERIDRREKVVFRADSDVLSLLEQAILDATGENVRVRLLPNGWLSFPPMMAVLDADQTRYIFSPTPPDQVQHIARRQGLAQLLLGRATDLTAYPIDALNSTPFIADDLSGAYGYVLARHQAPRRPLPRTDRWYLYLARPKTARWLHRLERQVKQTGSLRRFTDRLHGMPESKPSTSATDHTSKPGD